MAFREQVKKRQLCSRPFMSTSRKGSPIGSIAATSAFRTAVPLVSVPPVRRDIPSGRHIT